MLIGGANPGFCAKKRLYGFEIVASVRGLLANHGNASIFICCKDHTQFRIKSYSLDANPDWLSFSASHVGRNTFAVETKTGDAVGFGLVGVDVRVL